MRSGTHGSSVGIVRWIGVPSPLVWPSSAARGCVEAGGHEDGAALGVELEHLGRVGREEEAVLDGPLAHVVGPAASTVMSRASILVSRSTSARARRRRVGGEWSPEALSVGRRDFEGQPLQRPVAAALDRGRARRAAG